MRGGITSASIMRKIPTFSLFLGVVLFNDLYVYYPTSFINMFNKDGNRGVRKTIIKLINDYFLLVVVIK